MGGRQILKVEAHTSTTLLTMLLVMFPSFMDHLVV
jgi:hypothetical protein